MAALVCAAAACLQSCRVDPFCFNCAKRSDAAVSSDAGFSSPGFGGGGFGSSGFDAALPDGGLNALIQCYGRDTNTDPSNCGACGRACATVPGANTACVFGVCAYSCAANYYDLNGDVSTATGDGCEYYCVKTADKATQCTGTDVACLGPSHANDACDFANDSMNCGTVGNACRFGNAIAKCVKGVCQPVCDQGFGPDQSKPLPNCECVLVNGGKDTCGHDNDCDGKITPDLSSDPVNCGACGHSCDGAFLNTQPECKSGACVPGKCFDGFINNTGNIQDGCNYNCSSQCNFPFATGVCQANGTCNFGQCLSGHYDLANTKQGCSYACTPSGAEVCDGKDNNCNGRIDEGFNLASDPTNCGVCGCSCTLFYPAANVKCNVVTPGSCDISNCAIDSCPTGYRQVGSSACYKCPVFPTALETCNGLDDDCDGIIDDSLTDSSGSCTSSMSGACQAGAYRCMPQTGKDLTTDKNTCVPLTQPTIETCNGIDDDCDGVIDNAPTGGYLPGTGTACGVSQTGVCKFGKRACVNALNQDVTLSGNTPEAGDKIACLGEVDPKNELCNGADDDCNGIIDDNLQDSAVGKSCGSTVGICKQGLTACAPVTPGNATTDQVLCLGGVTPAAEICNGTAAGNGTDENCNGSVDEGCVFASSAPRRLDRVDATNLPAQGAAESFQLSTAQVGDDFVTAYSNSRSGSALIYTRASTDGGTSWGVADVAATAASSVEPHIFMRKGRAFLSYSLFSAGNRRINVVPSTGSSYAAWGPAVQVWNPGSTGIDCFSSIGVVAKADLSGANKDWLAVVWSEVGGPAATPTRDVRLTYSLDGGATWRATPIQVNAGAGSGLGEQPAIATDGAGMVYVAWRDKRTSGLAQAYVARISLTGSPSAMSNTQVLQPTTVAHASAEQITIAAEGTNVYVGWADLRAAAKTIRVAASSDAGVTWTQIAGKNDGQIVDPDGTLSDASAPSLAARSGTVIVGWEDRRSGQPNIRFTHSVDAGMTWPVSTPRVDTGNGLGAVAAYAPSVAFGQGSRVFVTWRDPRSPLAAILANQSLDGGNTWRPDASVLRADIDTGSPAAGASADSQSPTALAASTTNQLSVVFIDFRDAAGASGVNGNIWTRLFN